MVPFRDGKKYMTNELLYMTVDLEEGQIYEVSENMITLIQMAGYKGVQNINDLQLKDNKVTLNTILQDFNLDSIEILKSNYKGKEDYEDIHKLDLSFLSLTIKSNTAKSGDKVRFIEMKVALYKESYDKGNLEMGIVVMAPTN